MTISEQVDAPAEPPPRQPVWHAPSRSLRTTIGLAALGLAAIVSILWAWELPPFGLGVEVTDNAYVRGRTTVIAPQVSGYVVGVDVHDYEQVVAGQVLVRIDDRIYRARVAQAEASLLAAQSALANSNQAHAARSAALTNAQAQLVRAQADMARVQNLVRGGWVSAQQRDQARAVLAQAEAGGQIAQQDVRTVDVSRDGLQAQVDAARAQLTLAQIDLEHATIRALEGGQVGEIGVRVGAYVTNGTQLFSMIPPERWVVANYKEGQIADIVPGQPASFTVDGLGGQRFVGKVERLSPAAGSEFSVLKPDNATGNFVKVPQRIGVRISIDPGQAEAERLKPGMSVVARIDTSDGR